MLDSCTRTPAWPDESRQLSGQRVEMRRGDGAARQAGELGEHRARSEPGRVLDTVMRIGVGVAAGLLHVGDDGEVGRGKQADDAAAAAPHHLAAGAGRALLLVRQGDQRLDAGSREDRCGDRQRGDAARIVHVADEVAARRILAIGRERHDPVARADIRAARARMERRVTVLRAELALIRQHVAAGGEVEAIRPRGAHALLHQVIAERHERVAVAEPRLDEIADRVEMREIPEFFGRRLRRARDQNRASGILEILAQMQAGHAQRAVLPQQRLQDRRPEGARGGRGSGRVAKP